MQREQWLTVLRIRDKDRNRDMVEYDTPLKGQGHIRIVRDQIQDDIKDYLDDSCCASIVARDDMMDALNDIIVDNFKKLEE